MFLVMAIFVCSLVVAQSYGDKVKAMDDGDAQANSPANAQENMPVTAEGQGKPEDVSRADKNNSDQGQPVAVGKDVESVSGEPKGLAVALGQVSNENAKQQLEQNLARFQEMYQERLQRMENLEVTAVDEETGALNLKAQEPVKYFGFIQGKATKYFSVDSEGKISEKAPWYSIFYSEDNETANQQ